MWKYRVCQPPGGQRSSATVRTGILYLFTVIPLAPQGAPLQYVLASYTYSLLLPSLHKELSYSTYWHLILIHCYSPRSTRSSATVRTGILYLFTVTPLAPQGAPLQYVLASYTYSMLFPSLHKELRYSTYWHLILIHCYSPRSTRSSATVRTGILYLFTVIPLAPQGARLQYVLASYTYSLLFPSLHKELGYSTYWHLILIHCYSPRSTRSSATVRTGILYLFTVIPLAPQGARLQYVLASYTYSLLFPSLHKELRYSTYWHLILIHCYSPRSTRSSATVRTSILYLFTVIPLAPQGARLQYVLTSYTYSLLFPSLHKELGYNTYWHLILIHCYSPRSTRSSATVRTGILYLFTVIPLAPQGARLQYVLASYTYSLLFPSLHKELRYSTYWHLILIHCYSPRSTRSSATVRTGILYLFTVIPLAPQGAPLQYVLASYTYSLLFPSLHKELRYSTYWHLILIHCYSPRSTRSSATVRTGILYLFTVIPLAPQGAQLQYVLASYTYSLLFPSLHKELSYSTY